MKKLMAANWKMHKTIQEGQETAAALAELLDGKLPSDREVLLCPSAVMLEQVGAVLEPHGHLLGAQNLYPAEAGAFTGEISASQLAAAGCTAVLTGHSERRHVLGEDDQLVAQKTAFACRSGLLAVLCIGETLEERQNGQLKAILSRQLSTVLQPLKDEITAQHIVVAYEPVWAIGTGEVAGPQEILAAHAFVRQELVSLLGVMGKEVRILYGGSVKPSNAAEILSLDNVDGVLVGGASLEAQSFSQIVLA